LSIINDELHVRNASPAQVEVCGSDSQKSTYLLQFSVNNLIVFGQNITANRVSSQPN